jgi:hypothetical protein
MGPIGGPETSVQNYRSTLRNIPEERRYHLHRGGNLKSRVANRKIIADNRKIRDTHCEEN